MRNAQPSSVPSSELACRFNLPGSTTQETPLYRREDDEFQKSDPEAWELTHALIQDAHCYGLEEEDNAELFASGADCTYRAPIGERAFRKAALNPPVPWTGELRVEGAGAGDGSAGWWRTYFHDLIENRRLADDVLLSSVRLKTGDKRSIIVGRFKLNEQDQHVISAMNAARAWVSKQNRYQLRPRIA
mgnify:CR=1 FL=1